MTRTNKAMYANFYDMAIEFLIAMYGSIRVLEIGCTLTLNTYGSGSSNAFSNMPFVEKYVGIDKTPPKHDLGEKTTFIQGNAYTPETVDKVIALSERFHLIIDDGSHTLESHIAFFKLYKRFCAEKSFMVCEDVRVEYLQPIVDTLRDPHISFMAHPEKDKKMLMKNDICNLLVRFYSPGVGWRQQ